MRVVVAPDSFKASIGAAAAARSIAAGWRQVRPTDEVLEMPLADGGEGTAAVIAAAVPAGRWHPAEVSGPADARVLAGWLDLPGNGAIVELAAAAGLPLMPELSPLTAHSFGVGELIGLAVDAGVRHVDVALGGSACTDGGSGALAALGARFLDADGRELPRGGGALTRLAAVDLTGLRPPPPGGIRCLTDVRNPLLGLDGAAAVFGPQKGASSSDVAVLDAGLACLAALLGGDPAAAGAGAAGGCAYGLAAALGAALEPGATRIAEITGLPAALAGADLVITGEGRYDATSLAGKVVGMVLAAADAAGVAVAIVAGQLGSPPAGQVSAVELAALAGSAQLAFAEPVPWLTAAGRLLATDQATGSVSGTR
jgi:glycerate 2-kinase